MQSLAERISSAPRVSPPDHIHLPSWTGAHVYREGDRALIAEQPATEYTQERRDKAGMIELINALPVEMRWRLLPTKYLGEHEGRHVYEQPFLETWGGEWNGNQSSWPNYERSLKNRIKNELLADSQYLELYRLIEEAVETMRSQHPKWEITVDIPSETNTKIGWLDIKQLPSGDWCLCDPIGIWVLKADA